MANINLARRARIGLEKRVRTKAQLVAAGGALFSRRSGAAVTIDEIVSEAGVAKGTFYTHFEDLDEFTAAVADDLIAGLDALLVSLRHAIEDPFVRTAVGLDAFFGKGFEDRPWAGLVARMVRADATVGRDTRARFADDLTQALAALPKPRLAPELAVEAALGIVLQVLAAIGEGRLGDGDREPATGRCSRQSALARSASTLPCKGCAKSGAPCGSRAGRPARVGSKLLGLFAGRNHVFCL